MSLDHQSTPGRLEAAAEAYGGAVIPNNTPIVYPVALGTTPDPFPLQPSLPTPYYRWIMGKFEDLDRAEEIQ